MKVPTFFANISSNLVRSFRIVAFRIQQDFSFIQAASLTFQSLLAIVPILAVMFGIAKGFGLEQLLESIIRKEFHDQQQIVSYFIEFSYTLLEQTQGGIIAGVGIIVLLITVGRLLSNIEDTLNASWGVSTGRSLIRRVSDYLAIILICPILITASGSLTIFLTANIQKIAEKKGAIHTVAPVFQTMIPILPYIVATVLFTLVYIVMPNTRVRFRSSLYAGIFAGFFYQILQATYISIQLSITNVSAIYGSFAALPLFLLWLYASWLVFLIGAQIVVIHQERLWDPEMLAPYRDLSIFERELVMLVCIKSAITGFKKTQPVTASTLAHELKMPEKRIHKIIDELTQKNLIYQVPTKQNGELAIIPAQDASDLKIVETLTKIRGTCELNYPVIRRIEKNLEALESEGSKSTHNQLIKDI